MARTLNIMPLVAIALLLGACASPRGSVSFTIPAERYDETISAARETFLDARFELDRVDARAGVIETQPKHSAGLGTPWDTEQTTLEQEWSDLLNQHERVARMTVEPVTGHADNLTTATGELKATLEVIVYRVRRSGWRVDTESISRSSHSRDLIGPTRGQPNRFAQAIGRDDKLAEALAQRIRDRLGIKPEPVLVTGENAVP